MDVTWHHFMSVVVTVLYICAKGVWMLCFFCLHCHAWSCRCLCMGSMSLSSCKCCMYVSCLHPVAVSQCCILHDLQLVNAGRGCKRDLRKEPAQWWSLL